jgi:hypothetical protein
MVIEWDQVVIENTLLAAIIVGSIYLEQWAHDRSHVKEEKQTKKRSSFSPRMICKKT